MKDVSGVILNFRDLGGFESKSGAVARPGAFFRSGVPEKTDEKTAEILKTCGISVRIDFRAPREKTGDCILGIKQLPVDYFNIPYYDPAGVARIKEMDAAGRYQWPEIYIYVLETAKDWIRRVFTAFALQKGGVWFHCASGKDRTGLIAALLLDLAKAPEPYILADYAISQYELGKKDNPFYETSPQTMHQVLIYLKKNYGGACGYLKNIGVSEVFLDRVLWKFFE